MLIVTGTSYGEDSSVQVVYDTVADMNWKLVTGDGEKSAVVYITRGAATDLTISTEDALSIWKQLAAEATNGETAALIGALCTVVDDVLGLPFTEPLA